MLEGMSQVLLTEGQLAHSPDLRVGLERLLDFRVESAALDGDDLGRRVGVVRDGRAALGAEEAPDGLAAAALAFVFLDGALDGELVFGDDADEGCGVGRGLAWWVMTSDAGLGDMSLGKDRKGIGGDKQ